MSGGSTFALSPSFDGWEVLSEEPFGVGVGFLSFMSKIELREEGKSSQIIIKKECPPPDHPLYDFTLPLHEIELFFYSYFRQNQNYNIQASICTTFSSTNPKILLLQFLEGYNMVSYTQGTSTNQILPILTALTRIHAVFWSPPTLTTSNCPQTFVSSDFNVPMIKSLYENLQGPTIALLGPSSKVIIEEIGNKIQEHLSTFYSLHMSQGLTHGDLWANNVMIKQNECKLVDWQFSARRNPLTDIAFFLHSSVQAPLLKKHQKEWITQYYILLVEKTRCTEAYPFEQCWKEYKAAKVYALIIMIASFDCFFENYAEKESSEDIKERYSFLLQEIASNTQ